jgi:hypothetical protein
VNKDAKVDVFFKGAGASPGNRIRLQATCMWRVRCRKTRYCANFADAQRAELVVAGVNLVGLAFGISGEMAVVSVDSVFVFPLRSGDAFEQVNKGLHTLMVFDRHLSEC